MADPEDPTLFEGVGPRPEDLARVHKYERTLSDESTSTVWWTPRSATTMCAMVLLYGVLVIAIAAALTLKRVDKDTILKTVMVPMIIMAAVFLVVAGYTDKQIAPTIGLLGTIIGYVLGSTRNVAPSEDKQSEG